MNRLYEAFRRVNRTRRPEESIVLRATVLAAVMLAVVAAGVSGAAPVPETVAALVLLPAGAWLSHVRRAEDNTLIKVALTIGAVMVLMRFFSELQGAVTLEDTRQPLAGLFVSLQILHGFDLPQRRDLGFTLASSLALIALAAVNTHAGLFGLLLVVYAAVAAISMAAMQRSAAAEDADRRRKQIDGRKLAGADRDVTAGNVARIAPSRALKAVADSGAGLVRAAVPVVLVGLLVFLLLPRTGTNTFGRLPFAGFPGPQLPSALITNPGLAGGGQEPPEPGGSPIPFNPTAYFGLSEYVDLRTVGELSDDPIMRVRADRPRFWRGMVFDTYDGTGWNRSQDEPPPPTHGTPVTLSPQYGPKELGPPPATRQTDRLVQTFELLGDTPNLVFGAGEPREVWLSAGQVNRWDDGTISTSGVMDEGTIYSVVSEVPVTEPADLRTRTGSVPEDLLRRYTQLPDSLPDRVRELSADLTAGIETPYAKAEAVEAWIGDNTEYTLDGPPPPRGGDLVDHFLFESRQGWCEPIASSMVVLLRAAGVPARFATGFQPGRHNPVTGVWDVAMSNAHAWVEVWVPGEGWIPFDPTGAVPAAVDGGQVSRIPLFEIAGRLGETVARPVRTAIGAVAQLPPAAAGGLAVLLLVGVGLAVLRLRARRPDGPRSAFDRLVGLLSSHGVTRDDWQTPREYVTRVRLHRPDLPDDALEFLLEEAERARYGYDGAEPSDPEPSPAEERALVTVASRLEEGSDERGPRRGRRGPRSDRPGGS